MNPNYSWFPISNRLPDPLPAGAFRPPKKSIIDIMGAPIEQSDDFNKKINSLIFSDSVLCISGELKERGDGEVASNFRYKHNNEVNETVIRNYLHLFDCYSSITNSTPIIVTTIPRSWRPKSFFISESGEIEMNTHSGEKGRATSLMQMLNTFNICNTTMIKLRESCKSSRYNTYLIDMISFLYQMRIGKDSFQTTFDATYRKPTRVDDTELTEKDGLSRMYMDRVERDGYIFFVPKKSSVNEIYDELDEAMSLVDNTVKENIRKHCVKYRIERWSDFDANDIDDAFTILMIIHAFNCNEENLHSDELYIKFTLMAEMEPWFSQL